MCGAKMTYLQLREQLVLSVVLSAKNRIVNSRGIQGGKPSPASTQLSCPEVKHTERWSVKGKKRRCSVCSENINLATPVRPEMLDLNCTTQNNLKL
jgi:hypothetical protein